MKRIKSAVICVGTALVVPLLLSGLFYLFSLGRIPSFAKLYFVVLLLFGGPMILFGFLTLLGVFTEENNEHAFGYCSAIYYGGFFMKIVVSACLFSEGLSYAVGFLIAVLACLAFHFAVKADELSKKISVMEYMERQNNGYNA